MHTIVTPLGIALPGLLKGLEYFRRICDLIGDNRIYELLRRTLNFDNPWRFTLEAEYKFKDLILTEGKNS